MYALELKFFSFMKISIVYLFNIIHLFKHVVFVLMKKLVIKFIDQIKLKELERFYNKALM